MALNTTDWYEYPSNFSNGTSVEGVGSLVQYANVILGNKFGMGILLLIWLASFIMSLAAGSKKALMVASFISFVFSIYLVRLDMIAPLFVFILIILKHNSSVLENALFHLLLVF